MKINFNRIAIPTEKDKITNLFTQFIQCKICMNILNDPIDCICCNQTFCRTCIQNYIKTNNKCPYQGFFNMNEKKIKPKNTDSVLNNLKPSSSNFSRFIQSLKFYCQYKKNGCNEIMSIEEIGEHDKICKFKQVTPIIVNKCYNGNYVDLSNYDNKKNNACLNIFKDKIKYIKKKKSKELENSLFNYNHQQDSSCVSFKPIENNSQNSCVNTNTNTNNTNVNNNSNYNLDNNNYMNLSNYENINNYYTTSPFSTPNTFYTNDKFVQIMEEINSKLNQFLEIQKNNQISNNNNDYNNSNYLNTISDKKKENKETRNMKLTTIVPKEINNSYNLNYYKTNYFKKDKKKIIFNNSTTNFKINLKKKLKNNKNMNSFKETSKNKKNSSLENKKSKPNNLTVCEKKSDKECEKESILLTGENNLSTPKLRIKVIPKTKKNENINSEENDIDKDIIKYIKKLDDKINNIEKLIQSINCIQEQNYSVKAFDLREDYNDNDNNAQYNKAIQTVKKINLDTISKNKNNTSNNKTYEKNENINFEKFLKDTLKNLEENISKIVIDKFEDIKNYFGNDGINDIKNLLLDINIDTMDLYNEKFDNINKILNDIKKN